MNNDDIRAALKNRVSGILNTQHISAHKKGKTLTVEVPTAKLVGLTQRQEFIQPGRQKPKAIQCGGVVIMKSNGTTAVSSKNHEEIFSFLNQAKGYHTAQTLELKLL